jgi:hypothetical protein
VGFDWQGGGVPLVPGLMAHLERGLLVRVEPTHTGFD